jgi:signal recognition particle subunit SRP54
MAAGQFTFDDFLKAYKMLRRMGPLQGILKLIPGMREQFGDVEVDDRQLGRVEGIVLSMTPQERRSPIVIDGKRRLRIASGSGTTVEQVNQLLEARKQMEKMMKQMGRGKMPALPTQQAPTSLSAGRKSGVKRKKKRARR